MINIPEEKGMGVRWIHRRDPWLLLLGLALFPNGSLSFIEQDATSCYTRPAAAFTGTEARNFESPLRLALKGDGTDANRNVGTNSEDIDPVAKASWYAVEAFGNFFGKKKIGEEAEKEED